MSLDTAYKALEVRVAGPAKAVLLALSLRESHSSRQSFPSIERIAADAGLGTATVKRAVAKLETLGLVRVTRSKRSVNHYSVNLSAVRSDLCYGSERSLREIGVILHEGSERSSKEKTKVNLKEKMKEKDDPADDHGYFAAVAQLAENLGQLGAQP